MKISDLDKFIKMEQIKYYITKTDKDLKTRARKDLKRFIAFLVAFLMPMLLFFTTHQLIFIIIAFLVSFGVITYDTFSKNRLNASSIVNQIKEDSKILDNDDIYTKETKKVIENGIPKESIEDIKYQEALDKQKNKIVKLYLSYDEIIDSFFC